MGVVVRFQRAAAADAGRPADIGARLSRKLKQIRPDVRPELEKALEDFVDHLLTKQAASFAGRQ